MTAPSRRTLLGAALTVPFIRTARAAEALRRALAQAAMALDMVGV